VHLLEKKPERWDIREGLAGSLPLQGYMQISGGGQRQRGEELQNEERSSNIDRFTGQSQDVFLDGTAAQWLPIAGADVMVLYSAGKLQRKLINIWNFPSFGKCSVSR